MFDQVAKMIAWLRASYGYNAAKNIECAQMLEALVNAIPQWISIKERKPRTDECVLVFTNQGAYRTGSFRYVGSRGTAWFKCGKSCISCTHWMPLPEPPKEETDE